MKKCLLLTIAILGFASFSYAEPNLKILVCNDGEYPYLGASLVLGTDKGAVAHIRDNYDSSRNEDPSSKIGSGMNCKKVGKSLECLGRWGIVKSPAKVVFTKDTAGNVSATFSRSQLWDNEAVTFPCHIKEQLP